MYHSRILLGKRALESLCTRVRPVFSYTSRFLSEERKQKQRNNKFAVGAVGAVMLGVGSIFYYTWGKPEIPIAPIEVELSSKTEKITPPGKETSIEYDINLPTKDVADIEEQIAEHPLTSVEISLIEEVTPSFEEVPVSKEEDAQMLMEIQKEKVKILTTAYENLRLILDDTITTKNSAVRMLNGYVAEFADALLLSKDDPIYDSIWGPICKLYSKIQDSVSLVCSKESELRVEISYVNALIDDVRSLESNDIAIKAENLIKNSQEALEVGENEIIFLDKKISALLGFQRRLDEAHEEVQRHLRIFVPDLMKLLNLGFIEEAADLSVEDMVMLLSLRRPDLIRVQAQEKMLEQELNFLALMQDYTESVKHEAYEYHSSITEKIETEKNNEIKAKIEELKAIHQYHLEEELRIQHEVHCEKACEEKYQLEHELSEQFAIDMTTKLKKQEEKYVEEKSLNMSSLAGIETKVFDCLVADDLAREMQSLWSAMSLLCFDMSNVCEGSRTKKLNKLTEILRCRPSDDILSELLSSLSDSAAQFGVVTEAALMRQFHDIKHICKQVAAVQDKESSVFVYIFSYVKSWFVYSSFYEKESNMDINPNLLGAYEILERADYCIQQGDLEQAAKFMSQLKGVPRNISAEWLREVRLLLEAKQSVNLLLAYVTSLAAGFE